MKSISNGERPRPNPTALVSFSCLLRDIVNNPTISDENVGKIVRAVMADDDSIPLPTSIEHYVIRLRDDARKREATRLRVAGYRKARRENAPQCEDENAQRTVTGAARTVQNVREEERVVDVDSSSSEKTPSKDTQKTPPIVPLEEPLEGSLEKPEESSTVEHAIAKSDPARDKLTQAMFSYVGADAANVLPVAQSGNDTRTDSAWIPQHFARFWKDYPKKVAKAAAQKAFAKIIKAQPDVDKFMRTTMASLEWWKGQNLWRKDGGKFIPYPASWLNAGHWQDCEDNNDVVSAGGSVLLSKSAGQMSEEELVKAMLGEE